MLFLLKKKISIFEGHISGLRYLAMICIYEP